MGTQSLFRLNRYLFCFSVLFVLLVGMTVSGCMSPRIKMYPGEEVEPGKRAVIRAEKYSSLIAHQMDIQKVDGNEPGNIFTYMISNGLHASEVYVLPGKHNIKISLRYACMIAWADLWLVAEPGESYIVKSLSEGLRVRIWIENEPHWPAGWRHYRRR